MKARTAVVQGALALLALLFAYATWQREAPSDDQDVVILGLTHAELSGIRYEDAARWMELSWRKEGGEAVPWLRYAQKEPPRTPPPDAGISMAPAAAVPLPVREMKGNEVAQRLLEKFTPLRGVRSLGVLSSDKRKELGLEGSSRRLEVNAKGVSYSFTVSAGPLGTPYLLDGRDGKVYLVQGALLMDLDAGTTRLVDKRLHVFQLNEADGATVEAGGQRRTFVLTLSERGQLTQVAEKSSAAKPDAFAKNWLEKAWRLYPTDILGKGENPKSGPPISEVKIEYAHQGKPVGFVELARAGTETYARSENLQGWAKVLNVEELLRDAKRVAQGP